MRSLIEAVPNFSEGRNLPTIEAIAQAAREVARVLHIDRGEAANRTVITLAGTPAQVTEAAFRMVRTASQLIDMRSQRGEHPRIGAADVLPLVPIEGISLEECAELARTLGKRIGEELGIPVYCYEAAATEAYRRPLEACRRGHYEGLPDKLKDPRWRPDFGPAEFTESVARSGATIVGARHFLGAVNFNLNTAEVEPARAIACEVRASSGGLPCLKAIGWYIAEYGCAQVSTNLTDMHTTSLWSAYKAVSAAAARRGVQVTGTEVIGLLPEWVLAEAGREARNDPHMDSEAALRAAIETLGLGTLRPFDPDKRIVERLLASSL